MSLCNVMEMVSWIVRFGSGLSLRVVLGFFMRIEVFGGREVMFGGCFIFSIGLVFGIGWVFYNYRFMNWGSLLVEDGGSGCGRIG